MKRAALWFVLVMSMAMAPAAELIAQQNQPAAPAATKTQIPKVTLLEAGESPRKQLRLSVNKDSASTITMTMRMSMQQSMGAMQMPATKIPAMIMVMKIHVTEVHANGDFTQEFTFTDATVADEPGVTPQVATMMKDSLKSIVGLKGHAMMTNRGFVKNAEIEVPPDADAMVRQQLESMRHSLSQFAAPLPEEEVGPGGKWKVQTEMSAGGITMQQEAIMTLVKIDGDQLDIKVELTQTAPPQDFDAPGMPAGAKAHLNSMSSKGQGTMTVQLNNPYPNHASISTGSDQDMTFNMGGQAQQLKQHIEMTMQLERGEPKAETPPAKEPEKK